ncbi:hypothetical protein E4U41_000505 [Claviceps citrina]|nr:hypothetical protein E4U41_000505 [Claviceps citrina]
MSSKNWNDRADRDLFFTILSVKNIGVVSGGEWSMIGNHMRCMGYGFTNEGCRQHFQGLRRAQNKADADAAAQVAHFVGENPYRSDPTLNPITRRPGPGRGRPRKRSSGTQRATGHARIVGNSSVLSAPAAVQSALTPEQPDLQHPAVVAPDHGEPLPSHAVLTHMVASPAVPAEGVDVPLKVEDVGNNENVSGSLDSSLIGNGFGMGDADMGNGDNGAGEGEDADGEGVDEPPNKRQRLDDPPGGAEQSAPLDDQAVLALAAHGGVSASDFDGGFAYGDA